MPDLRSILPEPLNRLEPRVLWGAVAAILFVGVLIALALYNSTQTARVEPAATQALQPTAAATATPFRPRATPPGTPAPRPTNFVGLSASIPVNPPPAPRATASPEPGLWRIEGYVVDEAGKPIENVCVVFGPVSCQPFTPKTDERGHYFLDVAVAQVSTNFDVYFEYPGRETKWLRLIPTSSTVFNLTLRKT